MLQLNARQLGSLRTLQYERDIERLSASLAAAFPDVPARLGERYGELVAHGVRQAGAHGLDQSVCQARYLACCFMLGADFETRPGFGWALDMLCAPGLSEGARVFLLCGRTRQTLAEGAARFDQALAAIDNALAGRGRLGELPPAPPSQARQLHRPCDITAVEMVLLGTAADPGPRLYRFDADRWQRAAAAHAAATLRPEGRLHLPSQPSGGDFSRLRLRTHSSHCCDPRIHPLLSFTGPNGSQRWHGPDTAELTLDLSAAPHPGAGIATESPARPSRLSWSSCGLGSGAQADRQLEISVYSATQHLMAWRRDSGPAMSWPAPAPGLRAAPPLVRSERDGQAVDASRWLAGLGELDRELSRGLDRLAAAWMRDSGVLRPGMSAEPAVFSGTAGLTWGYAEAAEGPSAAPLFRVAGQLDLVACRLRLKLSGELAVRGSLSRVLLQDTGSTTLRRTFENAEALPRVRFRQPFSLSLEPLAAPAHGATLGLLAPPSGALVGSCGLRPRPGGGLQWFCELSVSPVSAELLLHDPLLGQHMQLWRALPGLRLLDWSLD